MSQLADQYRTFREQGGIVDLLPNTAFVFRGADRLRYLNGQVTANVAAAKPPCVLPACVTTAKGKLCASAFLTIAPDYILLDADLPDHRAGDLEARLSKYMVADDVTCTDIILMDNVHLLGVDPARIPAEDRASLLPVNRFGRPGFDLFRADPIPQPADEERTDRLEALFPYVSAALLEVLRIEAGVPRWGFELDDQTFPSEAGLDRTHVDYHKGCYIGQEVISRLRSVGHANRELRGFVADSPLLPGMRLFAASEPAKDLGRLTSATHSFALDRPIALGYLRRGAPESGLLAASVDSPEPPVPVTLHPLPFVS